VVSVAIGGTQGALAGLLADARPATIRDLAPTASHGHLYVLDVSSLAVYRFPLASDGLPAAKPDGILNPEGTKDPQGLAVDRSGHIFIADFVAQVVYEFAAGAIGQQKPMSTLNLPGNGPDHLQMDSAERLYVHYENGDGGHGNAIAIFAKGAQGNDPPISLIAPFYSPEGVTDYVISPLGVLFILDWSMGAHIIAYNNPLDSPSTPDVFLWFQGGLEFNPGYSMAFDDETNQLYFQFYVDGIGPGYYMNFAARRIPYNSTALDHMMFSGQCPAQDGQSSGAVVSKQYLIVACTFNPEVLVYRKDFFGHREPVEIIRGPLRGPAQIAIGP
jgi:hypothetical protein